MVRALHAFFGVSRVPFWTHFWGSLVGYTLPLLATAFFGERLFEFFANVPSQVWVTVGAALVLLAFGLGFWRWSRRRKPRFCTALPQPSCRNTNGASNCAAGWISTT